MAQTMLQRHDERTKALVGVVSELATTEDGRKQLTGRISGLDIQYDLGEGHALLGRRMPGPGSHQRALPRLRALHDARPLLLDLGGAGGLDIAPRADWVRRVDASHDGAWGAPGDRRVDAPGAVLVRPDGHVASGRNRHRRGLTEP